jgi:hypothetical protein
MVRKKIFPKMFIEATATEEFRFPNQYHHIRLGVENRKIVIVETKDYSSATECESSAFKSTAFTLLIAIEYWPPKMTSL